MEQVLEKLTVTQLGKEFQAFYKPEGSVPCSHGSTTGRYPEPDASSPHLPNLFP